ncbi:DNAse I-like superfamily protein, partial [Prunus dulcis]
CTLSNHLDQPTLENDFSQLRPPFQAIPVPNEPPHFPLSALPLLSLHPPLQEPETAAYSRVRQFFRKFVGARSPSFLNQIDRVRHQELGRSVKETFEGRSHRGTRIHHRASHSFRTTKGDSAEFSAEV